MWVLHYPPKKLANIVCFDVGVVVGFEKKMHIFGTDWSIAITIM